MKKLLIAAIVILIIATAAYSTTINIGKRGIFVDDGICIGCDGIGFYKNVSTDTPTLFFTYKDTAGVSFKNTGGVTFKDY